MKIPRLWVRQADRAPGQRAGLAVSAFALGLILAPSARAELSAVELAKLAQNPIANLVSVPFQNNAKFDFGPEGGTQNILNIQPVIPVTLNKDWNLIPAPSSR